MPFGELVIEEYQRADEAAYVATGEVTTLKHEVRDDTVEGRALVAEALLASAKGTEVLGGLGDLVIVEVEVDAAGLGCIEALSATEGSAEAERAGLVRGGRQMLLQTRIKLYS